MKKTLIATAIAAASLSGAALAQETMSASDLAAKMDSMPTVYGNIQLAYVYSDIDNGGSSSQLADNGSTIGIKHSHEIMPGLTGFFKAELEFDADSKAGNGGLNGFDEAYIGVEGDNFGKLWVGSDDSTYETAIDEIANHYEYAGQNIGGSYTTGEGDLIQYSTPSFNGLKLHGAVQVRGSGDANNTSGKNSYPYQLAATYEMDALELAVAMDSNDGNTTYSSNAVNTSSENTYGARASYTVDSLRVTGEYQHRKDFYDMYGLMGIYGIGANSFAASWERKSPDANNADDVDVFTLQALHNLSDNMYVYVEGYLGNGDNYQGPNMDQQTDFVVGGVYYF
ncbi:MAG: porin [Marinobacter sp.]|nr:porin [Marinobacter sp.]